MSFGKNDRFKSIEPEKIQKDVIHSFTISPAQEFKTYGLNYLMEYTKYMIKQLGRIEYAHIEIYTEMSKLGRLHSHGYITIKDVARFYLSDIHKLQEIGSFEIDTIKDRKVWDDYVQKQQSLMKPLYKLLEMPEKLKNKCDTKESINKWIRYESREDNVGETDL